MLTVILLLVFCMAASWVTFWVVPRSLRRSRSEMPTAVPEEWVAEFRDRGGSAHD